MGKGRAFTFKEKLDKTIWTNNNIFGRLHGDTIRWNLTPHPLFLPRDVGAWLIPPIRTHRLSQSPDPEAQFMAHPDLENIIYDFLQGIGNQWQPSREPPPQTPPLGSDQESSPARATPSKDEGPQVSALPLPCSQSSAEQWAVTSYLDDTQPLQEEGAATESVNPQANRQPVKSRNKKKCNRKGR